MEDLFHVPVSGPVLVDGDNSDRDVDGICRHYRLFIPGSFQVDLFFEDRGAEFSPSGITEEALLAILQDRAKQRRARE